MSSIERRSSAKIKRFDNTILDADALRDSRPQVAANPCITILLGTFNGARFLPSQLASLERQTHTNWRLIVSDDHSTDATVAIVKAFARRVSQVVELRRGPRTGPCANFLSLASDPSIEGEYFAFCDQDDIWHRDKLSCALRWVRSVDAQRPAIYGSRTHLVCAAGRTLGHSALYSKGPSFGNALVQNIAGANTMAFNRATKALFEQSGCQELVAHDWWAYQLVTGGGGVVHYDPTPLIDYRQHDNNRIGSNKGWRAQWKRLRILFGGGYVVWNEANYRALRRVRHLLTQDAKAILDAFEIMRSGGFVARLRAFFTSPVRRQTLLGNVALLVATVLRKV
jgi:glycosyltransferase involved in cell wall biosynthesis